MKQYFAKRTFLAGFTLAALALGGCSTQSNDPVYTQFYSEAGSLLSTGAFGAATLNNNLVLTGEMQYTYDLAGRFANDVPTTVNFKFNSSQLDAPAKEVLRRQARWIRAFPEVRFRVYGHTDAIGSNRANKSLGLRRANAVVRFLTSQGIKRSRLEAVVSYGETQPLVLSGSRERRNRRTVTEVNGFVHNHPTVLDGKYAQIIYRDYVASGVPISVVGQGSSSVASATE